MSLEEIWHRAGLGYNEAITEFHIVGGLHPTLTSPRSSLSQVFKFSVYIAVSEGKKERGEGEERVHPGQQFVRLEHDDGRGRR